VASAEELCTDTWVGPSEGSWQAAANWSSGHEPSSSDVACVASGKTAVSAGTGGAGVVRIEGSLVIVSGTFEVGSLLMEPSSVHALTLDGGTLTGLSTVTITGSLAWGNESTMSGTGPTVLAPGATGTVEDPGIGRTFFLDGRSLVNEGSLTVGREATLSQGEGSVLTNKGTLVVNGHIASGVGATPELLNDGTVEKTEGTGQTRIHVPFRNEGTVNPHERQFEFEAGGSSASSAKWASSGSGRNVPVERSYDKAGRLESVKDWLEHTTKFSYDADSEPTAIVFPAGTGEEDTYVYNNADQMTEVKASKGAETLASLSYARDNDGQVQLSVGKGLPGKEMLEYTYDENNRLAKGAGTAYGYDAASNPTTIGSGAYKYDNANELETGPGVKYTYNELGERTKTTPTTGPATAYGYDQAGDLTTVERPKEGETAKIEDAYTYNGDGLRSSETITGAARYLAWDVSEGLPIILGDGTNSYIYGPEGLPVEQINNSTEKVQYLHHDQSGSTRIITGSTGTIEGAYTYSPYGATESHTGTATTPLGYDGQYTSSDTGLIYLRARVYHPATAQFLSVDPMLPITGEPYSYTGDNPLNAGDPSGLCNANPFTGGFWTEGNCLSGAVGGPNGGGSQPVWWDIPAYGAVAVPCVAGAEALCAGGLAASGAAQARGSGSSECGLVGTVGGESGLPPSWEPPTNEPQMPPTDIPPGWRVREMPPTAGYPNGYWRLEKPMPQGGWQGIDPSTGKPGTQPETHVPFPEGEGEF
jgi:RHS repeat-associated protein